ncbi:MAG: D-cysteine desulfhydrase family protein [Pseudohongiellaceae bacterium]|nr:D-cysteine desulfhydrase family protein [Pseudohongiellaceae bacterium]
MLVLPPRMELARLPTPITPLTRFALPAGSPRVWVKRDEMTGTEVSGNKIRKLEFSLAQAKEEGCDVIITCGGLQSNHCRATAILGARLGLEVHLILRGQPEEVPDGNHFLDLLVGANITYLAEEKFSRHPELARELQREYEAKGSKAFFIPTGASDEIGLWGYLNACQELKENFADLGISPEYLVVATGSGGTQAGLILGNRMLELGSSVHAYNVCDNERYFGNKVRTDLRLWQERYAGLQNPPVDVEALAIETIDGYVGPGYAKAEAHIFELIAELARTEGIILDPVYTAKAFYGLLEEIRRGRYKGCRDIVFIHTGGVFGLFPQKRAFAWQ